MSGLYRVVPHTGFEKTRKVRGLPPEATIRGPVEGILIVTFPEEVMLNWSRHGDPGEARDILEKTLREEGWKGSIVYVADTTKFMTLEKMPADAPD